MKSVNAGDGQQGAVGNANAAPASGVQMPALELPKGGGAIRGMGEKFAASPVTGTGTVSIPITTSPGRSGAGPQLSLGYDSAAGNGPFGFGWNLALASITRKSAKGLPQYADGAESDEFLVAGAEDLVPVLRQDPDGSWIAAHPGHTRDAGGAWVRNAAGQLLVHEDELDGYRIRRYRPRVEGLFARIERWAKVGAPHDVHWCTFSRDNVLTLYGLDANARIADPLDARRIFSWLICEVRDDKGNAVLYRYKAEDGAGVDAGKLHERNRGPAQDVRRGANRYLKRIHYGNRLPLLDTAGQRPRLLDQAQIDLQLANGEWLFEVVFDYGDHAPLAPAPRDDQALDPGGALRFPWHTRADPFSHYRAGFEVRTMRLCRRVLMFHHFPGEEGVGADCLVRSTDFHYAGDADPGVARNPVYTFLRAASHTGYRRSGDGYEQRSTPPVSFEYSLPQVQDRVEHLDAGSLDNLPVGLDGAAYRWADLHGEGIAGILTEQAGAWHYKRNLSPLHEPGPDAAGRPAARFAPRETVAVQPNARLDGGAEFMDLAGDGQTDLVLMEGPLAGLYEHDDAEGWRGFRPFTARLNRDLRDPNLRFIDLDGDGHVDALITEHDAFVWHASLAEQGFGAARRVVQALDEEQGPRIVFADACQSIYLADVSGDGLTDIVRIRNGDVCYWPNLGYGKFGAKVGMDNAPRFDSDDQFQHQRIRLADIDGSGTTDLIYLHRDGVRLYFNQSGNGWSAPQQLNAFARVDNLASIMPTDLLGNGTACLVWSSPLPADAGRQMRYVSLMGARKPHLLVGMRNNLGAETRVHYATSTKFYLQDKRDGKPWITKLPFPVHAIEQVETRDHIAGTRFVRRFAYHHGCYDGAEREFRGFGMVEQFDSEDWQAHQAGVLAAGGAQDLDPALHQAPVRTRTWFHTGMATARERILHQFQQEYYSAAFIAEPALPAGLDADEWRECVRALKGVQLRQEIYSDDGTPAAAHPYVVTESSSEVRRVQPRAGQRHAVFLVVGRESVAVNYERNLADPRIAHTFSLQVDEYGQALEAASLAYGRRVADPLLPAAVSAEQQRTRITCTETDYTADLVRGAPTHAYRLRVPYATRDYEYTGIAPAGALFAFDELAAALGTAIPIAYEVVADGVTAQQRLLAASRSSFLDNALAPMPAGQWDTLGLGWRSETLAFTEAIAALHFGGEVSEADFTAAGYVHVDGDSNWWIPSGTPVYPADPAAAFYIPAGVRDSLGLETLATYDQYLLLIEQVRITQAAWNTIVAVNDYRMLGPVLLTDPNGNRSAVAHDALGLVERSATMGRAGAGEGEGDTLAAPTTRIEYELFNWMLHGQPNFAHSFAREQHGAANTRWQESYAYSNGSGGVDLIKAQAHPGKALQVQADGSVLEVDADPRWVGSGRTVVNNKGKPVRQYEPYFSTTHGYENAAALRELGVSSVTSYDPLGRNVRTDFPNGTVARVEFTPWLQKVFDANDTVRASRWYSERGSPDAAGPEPLTDPEARAAWLAAAHDDTPGVTHFDSMGRRVYAVTDFGGGATAAVRSEIDLTGRYSRMFDQQGREVASGFVSLGGIPVMGESAEKGRRWIFHDVLGAMVKCWDAHGRRVRCEYDALHRAVSTFVREPGQAQVLWSYVVYGDRLPAGAAPNLLGTTYLIYDQSGQVRIPLVDFKGNATAVERALATSYSDVLDWIGLAAQASVAAIEAAAAPALNGAEVFTVRSRYDALNRPMGVELPGGTEILPTYNVANFLTSLRVRIQGQGPALEFLQAQDFNAKGQRLLTQYGNGVLTRYFYDPLTFRLAELLTTRAGAGPDDALQDLKYCYDPVGNLAQVRDDAQQTHYFNNAVVKPESRYAYDAAYQLVRATGRELAGLGNDNPRTHGDLPAAQLPHPNNSDAVRNYTEEFEYDLLGNLRTFRHRFQSAPGAGAGWTRHYRYAADAAPLDRTNRLLATSMPGDAYAGPYSGAYQHDVYGNMTSMPHLAALGWDAMDQLRRVDLGGGGVAWYVYDNDGQRLRKVIERPGNLRVERIYLGCVEIYRERLGQQAPHLERYTVQLVDAGVRLAQIDIKTRDENNIDPANPLNVPLIRYQHGNHAGSAVLETDSAAAVLSYEEYHPFGTSAYRSSRPGADLSLKRVRFGGRERDDESGLYFLGARYYAPWLGRWTSSDPGGYVDGPNLYRYCHNSPVMLEDPGGLDPRLLPGTAESHLTAESTLADREAFARRHGMRLVDPQPDLHRFVGGNWLLSPEGRFEPLPTPTPAAPGTPPITTDSASTAGASEVDVTITPSATPDANPGTTGTSGGSASAPSGGGTGTGSSGSGSGSGDGAGSGQRSFFTSSFFRGLVTGLVITVAVVAVVATGGAALAVIAPGAAAAISASGVGTALAVGGTLLAGANTVQSLRQRSLMGDPISEDEANYNLGLGIGAAAGGALSRPVAAAGTALGTSIGRGGSGAVASMVQALEGGTLATASGMSWGGGAAAASPAVSGISTTTAVTIAGVGVGTTTLMARGHTADWELRGPDGRIDTRGRISSGSPQPPGRRLTWNEQLSTHTERKILDMLRGRVNPGDHITIRGTKPPCDPGGRGCGSAMQAFAEEMQIRITYTDTTTGQIWRYP